jgi:hypothetical protein
MPQPTPPELFAERPVRSDFAQKKGIPYAVRRKITLAILALILIGGGAGLYAMRKAAEPISIPTIKADGTLKQRPAEPGGIDIPHQDVEVYQALDTTHKNDKPEVEHLMPMPETPQVTGLPVYVPSTAATTIPTENILAPGQAPKIPTTVSVVAPQSSSQSVSIPVGQPAPKSLPITTPEVTPTILPQSVASPPSPSVDVPKISEPPKPARAAPFALKKEIEPRVSKGDVSIQLASVPNEKSAQQMLARLKNKYAGHLGRVLLRLVRVDLGAKGIYYRIQSQPVSLAEANHLCAKIKQTNAGCILVRH